MQMQNATFFGDVDYQTEKEKLVRKQAIIEAMSAQALAPLAAPEAKGRLTPTITPLSALAKFGQQYMAKGKEDEFMKQKSEFGQWGRRVLQEDAQAFADLYEVDPKKAVLQALSSRHPFMQQLALQKMLKEKEGKTKDNFLTVDKSIYDISSGKPEYAGGTTFEAPYQLSNGTWVKRNATTGEVEPVDKAPKAIATANVAGTKAGATEYWKNAAGQVDALGKVANQAQTNLQAINELKKLDNGGIFSNVTTGPATFFANLGEAAGIRVDTSKLANTESFNAIVTELWQGLVSKYGGNRGVTQQEAEEIKKMLPQAAASPQARQQIYGILERASKRQIGYFQRANKAFAEGVREDDPNIFAASIEGVYTPPEAKTGDVEIIAWPGN